MKMFMKIKFIRNNLVKRAISEFSLGDIGNILVGKKVA